MKKVVFFLALCFLLEWAYTTKIKPFIMSEFGLGDDGKTKGGGKNGNGGGSDSSSTSTGDLHPSTGAYAYGLDISKYQGKEMNIPFGKDDSVSFVICKATEGATESDVMFTKNWAEIAKRGFFRGAYHFYRSNDDPVLQANHFLSVVGPLSKDDFPPIVDVEEGGINPATSVQAIKDSLLIFLKKVEELSHRTPMIYADLSIANKYMSDPAFAAYPFWYAHYKSQGPGPLPGAWKGQKWTMWQKSDHYYVNTTANDFDIFNGPVDSLESFINKNHLK